MFDSQWIDVLKQGLIINGENPTHRARTWDRDAEGRTMFWDSQAWRGIEEYQQFIFHSPAAQLAGELLLKNGLYQAYGQDLEVRRGELHFVGPVRATRIDVNAVRIVDDVQAGNEIRPDELLIIRGSPPWAVSMVRSCFGGCCFACC